MNIFDPSSFEWIPSITPMSDLKHLALAEIIYFTVIFGLQAYLKNFASEKTETKGKDSEIFKFSLCLHNAILCLLSLVMLIGAGFEAWLRSRLAMTDKVCTLSRELHPRLTGRKASRGSFVKRQVEHRRCNTPHVTLILP